MIAGNFSLKYATPKNFHKLTPHKLLYYAHPNVKALHFYFLIFFLFGKQHADDDDNNFYCYVKSFIL
jgi:hypothetical protein